MLFLPVAVQRQRLTPLRPTDPNALLGVTNRIDIPDVVVKWITYALVLHIVALVCAAGSALFGLLAHVREMSMVCCSSCFSGFAATVALFAFIFDIVFFFLVKSRIKAVGGSAELGTGLWLTLAAWVLLFFAGCFYGFGQCCIRKRPRGPGRQASTQETAALPYVQPYQPTTDNMRLDAVKAEQDRKARVKMAEGGLPAFQELESKPLRTQYIEDDDDEDDRPHQPYRDASQAEPRRQASIPHSLAAATGYAAAPRGTRAMDDYYAPAAAPPSLPQPAVAYPPQPRQYQQNQSPSHMQIASHYPEIVEPQPQHAPARPPSASPAMGHQLFATPYGAAGHGQDQLTAGYGHGHEPRGTTFHSAHSYFPSTYSEPQYVQGGQYAQQQPQQLGTGYLPPGAQAPQQQQTPGQESYYTADASTPNIPGAYGSASPARMMTPPGIPQAQPYRNAGADASYYSYQAAAQLASHPSNASSIPDVLRTAPARQATVPNPPRGPRSPTSPTSPTTASGWPGRQQSLPTDQPPSYETGPSSNYYYNNSGKS